MSTGVCRGSGRWWLKTNLYSCQIGKTFVGRQNRRSRLKNCLLQLEVAARAKTTDTSTTTMLATAMSLILGLKPHCRCTSIENIAMFPDDAGVHADADYSRRWICGAWRCCWCSAAIRIRRCNYVSYLKLLVRRC